MTTATFIAGNPSGVSGFEQVHPDPGFSKNGEGEHIASQAADLVEPDRLTGSCPDSILVCGIGGLGALTSPVIALGERKAAHTRRSLAERLLGWAAFCCLLGAGIALLMLPRLEHSSDVLLCLVGAMGASVLVCYLYFSNN